jgi:hypothetical protein
VGSSGLRVGVGEGEGAGVAVEVGVGVSVAKYSGVTEARTAIIGVGVRVVNRATRRVGKGVGVGLSETKSPKRQAIAATVLKQAAKIIKFFSLKFPNPNKDFLYSIVRAGSDFLDASPG